ncbi:type 2 lanthipeptide synthetase LanM family protein [Plantactinospora sp. CA-290183]|uniref:type 2 lanthipeptide synthetase LanM family protein n=1 Tax=Plantactinospora sp. CA-290183 TaxID=3240006 RepID=UPI003D8AC14A
MSSDTVTGSPYVDVADPQWALATSVWDRGAAPETPDGDVELARRRFERWLAEAGFGGDADRLAERLGEAGLAESDFRGLLGEPPAQLRDRLRQREGGAPEWLRTLAETYAEHTDDPRLVPDLIHNEMGLLLEIVAPLLGRAARRLSTLLDELEADRPGGFDVPAVRRLLLRQLCAALLFRLTRVAVLEVNIANLQGTLTAPDPAARFREFVQLLRRPERSARLLAEYPLLARDLVTCAEQWWTAGTELLHRIADQRDRLAAFFFAGRDPGAVADLVCGVGDTHRGGRSVAIVRFADGSQVVYKPRSLAVDVHFQELLSWLNARGAEPDFRPVPVLDLGDHGWMEFVASAPCASPAEVARFYRRQGGYLALMHCLHAVDFHYENLIAAGEHPVLIDLEAMFHPSRSALAAPTVPAAGTRALEASVLAIGLLPQRQLVQGQPDETAEFSGITGGFGQLSPTPVACMENEGTDRMRVVRRRVEMAEGHNRASLHGGEVDALDHVTDVLAGFEAVARLLSRHRAALLADDGPLARFAGDEVRCIVRPTQAYANMLVETTHPYLLRDAAARDRYLDNLWSSREVNGTLNAVCGCERHDLYRGDVPVFTTRPGSRDMRCAEGHRLPERLAEPMLAVVRRRIAALDEAELLRQAWMIRASFTALTLGEGRSRWPETTVVERAEPADPAELVEAAREVGEHLRRLRLPDGDGVTWLGLSLLGERVWEVRPLAGDLYTGLPGVLLFFAYLDVLLPDRGYAEVVEEGLGGLLTERDRALDRLDETGGSAVGAFEQMGGVVYLLTHLGVLWDRPDLLASARDTALRIARGLGPASGFDIISGAAGFLCVLLGLHRATGDEVLADEIGRCADLLVALSVPTPAGRAWPDPALGPEPLAGFSHGASGVARALLWAYEVTGRPRYLDAAEDAMAYERGLLDGPRQNWPDLRELDPTFAAQHPDGEPVFMTAWCHGAPGIGLTRLHALRCSADPGVRSDLAAALATTLREGLTLNHSLCHGSLGNLELLLAATRTLSDPDLGSRLYRLAGGILDGRRRHGWMCGVPGGVETPGLMTGLAGIGYGLLRLAAPDRVPSLLDLSAPSLAEPSAGGASEQAAATAHSAAGSAR